jgi:phosphotriesterase-related protein
MLDITSTLDISLMFDGTQPSTVFYIHWISCRPHAFEQMYNSPTMSKFLLPRLTRRQTLKALGAGAAAAIVPSRSFAQKPTFPQGAIIRTVLKDYAPDELRGGATLFHEHLQLASDFNARFGAAAAAARSANGLPPLPPRPGGAPTPAGPDIMHDVDLMSAEVTKAAHEGNIACIVDAGHKEMGRDINFLRQVAMKSGVPIVAGGGFYSQPFYPTEISTMSEEQIFRALIKQADDDVVGAFGEIGSWDEITADERKVFRAVGRAHVATNIPIFTHTGIPGKSALEQLDILEDAGVKPDRVVIGHLGNLVDPNVYVQKAICRRGAFVGFDRQGGNNDAQQVPLVMALLEAGFADHLVFSADASSGYAKTITVFLPKLKAAGASDDILHHIMVDNPRRFLAFAPKRPRRDEKRQKNVRVDTIRQVATNLE